MRLFRLPLFLARLATSSPWTTLLLSALFTALMGIAALQLELHNDLIELLPPKMPQVQTIRQVLDQTGGLGYQAVIASSPDPKANQAFLRSLQKSLYQRFWLPPQSPADRLFSTHEECHRLLRQILYVSRHPDENEIHRVSQKVEKFWTFPLLDFSFRGYDKSFFEKRKLFFLSKKELLTIEARIKAKIRHELKKRQPGYVDLLGDSDPGLDISDIEKRYQTQLDSFPSFIQVKEGSRWFSALMLRPRGAHTDLIVSQHFMRELNDALLSSNATTFHPQMQVKTTGAYSNNLAEYNGISADLQRAGKWTILFLLLTILLFFRNFRSLPLIVIPLGVGAIWSFGFAWLLVGYLTTATGFIGVVLLGLGIDYGVYLLHRTMQESAEGYDIETAILRCYRWTGVAIATSAVTTAAAFFTLLICRFTGFSQFGIIAGAGVLLCLLSVNLIQPALIVLLDRWRPMAQASHFASEAKTSVSPRPFPLATTFTILGVAVLGASIYTAPRTPFEYQLKNLAFQTGGLLEQEKEWKRFEALFSPQSMNPIVFLARTPDEARQIVSQVDAIAKNLRDKKHPDARLITGAFSPFTFVPQEQKEKLAILHSVRTYLEKNNVDELLDDGKPRQTYLDTKPLLSVHPFDVSDLPSYVQQDLVLISKDDFTKPVGYLVILQSDADYSDGRQAARLLSHLSSIRVGAQDFPPSGEPVIFVELLRVIHLDSLFAIFGSLLMVAFLVWLDLRSFSLMLLSLWPLLTGLMGMTVVLFLFDIRLNVFNMVVLPAFLGMGIDAGVHLLHRYRESPALGSLGVQRELRKAIFVASFTTVVSFASMLLAHHQGIRSLGSLASVGLTTCLIGSLLFLPALMEIVFRLRPLQAESELQ